MTKKKLFHGVCGANSQAKTRGFLAGTLGVVLAFALAAAGCDLTSGDPWDPGDTVDPAAAAELAADINAMEGQSEGSVGSAEVNGATVKITGGFVDFRKDITVAKGVTLDVTEDGAAIGLHDVTLTVNGTVNAGPDYIRLEDTASWAIINGSGTIYLKSRGYLLQVQGNKNVANRKLTLDGVTLAGVNNNSEPLVGIGAGGEFILKSGKITGNTRVGDEWSDGGGVGVWEDGLFTMKGGIISGNTAKGGVGGQGGGVAVNGGTFAMQGGKISGNSAKGTVEGGGGGVRIDNEGIFNMSGGEISGNSATGTDWSEGAGVKLNNSASFFTMKGGAISGNTATGVNMSRGGGVYMRYGAVFTMEDGAISDNTAVSGGHNHGGGVCVNSWDGETSTFTMKSGAISGNTATGGTDGSSGGGVQVEDGSVFTMQGGAISDNTAEGGSEWDTGGGGVFVNKDSTFTMQGGEISANTAKGAAKGSRGGGVKVQNRSVFTMESGAISGNTAEGKEEGEGGGVALTGEGPTFIMQDGAISDNNAKGGIGALGGGVFVDGGTFTLSGGAISGNRTTGTNWSAGGGVRVQNNESVFIMEGGTIYGKAESLPAGTDPSFANSARDNVSLTVQRGEAKWGMGGEYTKDGESQTGDGDIVSPDPGNDSAGTDATLIATP
jgi:hypothetical protein